MPRGRLPTGMVACTFKVAPLMTVTSPDFSLETKMRYPGDAAAAVCGEMALPAPIASARREICRADARVSIGMSFALGQGVTGEREESPFRLMNKPESL